MIRRCDSVSLEQVVLGRILTDKAPRLWSKTGGLRLLFDAGRGVATQLARVGAAPEQLDAVFITHHHFDHIGGLGDVLMAAW